MTACVCVCVCLYEAFLGGVRKENNMQMSCTRTRDTHVTDADLWHTHTHTYIHMHACVCEAYNQGMRSNNIRKRCGRAATSSGCVQNQGQGHERHKMHSNINAHIHANIQACMNTYIPTPSLRASPQDSVHINMQIHMHKYACIRAIVFLLS